MKKMKRFVAMVLAGVMAAAMVFPSMAANYRYGTGSTEIIQDGDERWAAGKNRTYPSWAWINGYCYYLDGPDFNNRLKNCVTPDGWTVDAEGRWIENGVAVSNGYGGFVIGTDELYTGKTDAERWNVMRGLLENLFANHIYGDENTNAMRSAAEIVQGSVIREGWSDYYATFRPTVHANNVDYLHVAFNNHWNDCPDEYVPYRNEVIEKVIKITCGDHVGQELFNDLRAAAEGANGGTKIIPIYDENGMFQFIDENHILSKTIENCSDGIDFTKFDLTKWNGRKTDYGKTIRIEYQGKTDANGTGDWEIWITD